MNVTDEQGVSLGLSPASYAAFGSGMQVGSAGDAARNPGYNGHESAGGLVYMRNRWYDPNTGRFTQEDPIGYAGGINLYGYVGNNPLSFSDPFGLKVTVIGKELQEVITQLMKSETFKGIFEALDNVSESRVNIVIRAATGEDLGRWAGEKSGGEFDRPHPLGANSEIVIDTRPDAAKYREFLLHEVIHAGGSYSDRAKTGVEWKCQFDTEVGHACVKEWTDKINKELEEKEKPEQ